MCKQWMAFCLGAAFTASGGEQLPTTVVGSSVVLSYPDNDSCESKHESEKRLFVVLYVLNEN
jgi:hypothetical protein